jgi:hypothetical protein
MKQFFYVLMILSLLAVIFFLFVGLKFTESAVQEASAAGFACVFGIISRIFQAEAHKSE